MVDTWCHTCPISQSSIAFRLSFSKEPLVTNYKISAALILLFCHLNSNLGNKLSYYIQNVLLEQPHLRAAAITSSYQNIIWFVFTNLKHQQQRTILLLVSKTIHSWFPECCKQIHPCGYIQFSLLTNPKTIPLWLMQSIVNHENFFIKIQLPKYQSLSHCVVVVEMSNLICRDVFR